MSSHCHGIFDNAVKLTKKLKDEPDRQISYWKMLTAASQSKTIDIEDIIAAYQKATTMDYEEEPSIDP